MAPTTFRMAALAGAAFLLSLSLSTVEAAADDVTLTIESWRNDDLPIWQEKIIPAFEAKNPGIKVVFSPTAPTEYNAALNAKLDAGTAGDLITCRPFDASLELYNKGHLADLTDLPGMDELLGRGASPPGDRRRQGHLLRADGLGHPRLHLQQGRLREARHHGADDRGRVLRRARQDQGGRHLHPAWPWAPTTSGKPPPWATRISARTTGRARKAAWR